MVNRLNETQKVGLARRVNPPSITLEEKARFPSSGGLCWYEISPIHENPMTLRGGSSHPPAPLIFRPNWKQFFLRLGPPPPPYLKFWICHWLCMVNLSLYFSLVCSSICHKSLNTKRNIEMQVSKLSCWLPPVFVLQVLFWSPSTGQC